MKSYSSGEYTLKYFSLLLKQGKVFIYPTETAYGLGCDPLNKKGVQKVYDVKGRPRDMHLPLICSSVSMVSKWCMMSSESCELAQRFWPGPLTLVLPLRTKTVQQKKLCSNLKSTTVAVRVSSHDFARGLSRSLGNPVVSTSANISGRNSLYTSAGIFKEFEGVTLSPDGFIDFGDLQEAPVSTIVNCTTSPFSLIRQGKITIPKQFLS